MKVDSLYGARKRLLISSLKREVISDRYYTAKKQEAKETKSRINTVYGACITRLESLLSEYENKENTDALQ